MPWIVQSSSNPQAIGAGSSEVHFNDLKYRLTFTGEDHTAVVLATFKDGKELKELRDWARTAHNLTEVDIEPFDAKSEADKRQEEADQEAADQAEAATKAKAMIRDAKADAARIMNDARDKVSEMLAAAKAEAEKIVAEAKSQVESEADQAAAAASENDGKGKKKS